MHPTLRAGFHVAIQRALRDLEGKDPTSPAISLLWRRGMPSGEWSGAYERVPVLGTEFTRLPWEIYAKELEAGLKQYLPDHAGPVGSSLLTGGSPAAHHLAMGVVEHLWRLQGDFNVPGVTIERVLDDISAFIDCPVIHVAFIPPLLNFSGPTGMDYIELTADLAITLLSEAEVTRIFGGSPFERVSCRRNTGPHEWAFTGTIREPKLLGN